MTLRVFTTHTPISQQGLVSRRGDWGTMVLIENFPWFWQAFAFFPRVTDSLLKDLHSSIYLYMQSQLGPTQAYNNGAEFLDTLPLLGPLEGETVAGLRRAGDLTHWGQGNLLLPQSLGTGVSNSWTRNFFQPWGLPSLFHETALFLACGRGVPNIPASCFLHTCT